MTAIITILFMVNTWNVLSSDSTTTMEVCQDPNHPQKPFDCNAETCVATELAPEICTDLGGVSRCYWADEDVIYWGEKQGENRLCDFDGDAECIVLDATRTWAGDLIPGTGSDNGNSQFDDMYFLSCLRCCPNEATGHNLCTETISTDGEQCGSAGIELEFYTYFEKANYANIAPCCPNEQCLDNIAGICGVEGQACDPCTKWSFILDEENSYHTGDSCGEGLICLDDGSDPLIKYKPNWPDGELNDEYPIDITKRRLFDKGDESIFNRLPIELQRRHRRRLQYDTPPGLDEMIYHSGICVPLTNEGTCDHDSDCAGCMRCCDGECKRISVSSESPICGFTEGRGPCCCGAECCDNECVTKSPTDSPTTTAPTTTAPTTTAPTTPAPTNDD